MPNHFYTYILNIYGLVWLGLWHINYCGSFNAKFPLYIYIKYIWFCLVGFHGISTIDSYLMPNPLHTHTHTHTHTHIYIWFGWVGFYGMLLYTHLPYHNDSIIKTHAERHKRKTQEETTQDKDAGGLLFKYIHLSLYCKGFERVVQSLHVRGCWRPNINFIFWPHCYDRHAVSFLFSWCWGLLHRGFPSTPSVGCGVPYHIWSLLSGRESSNIEI